MHATAILPFLLLTAYAVPTTDKRQDTGKLIKQCLDDRGGPKMFDCSKSHVSAITLREDTDVKKNGSGRAIIQDCVGAYVYVNPRYESRLVWEEKMAIVIIGMKSCVSSHEVLASIISVIYCSSNFPYPVSPFCNEFFDCSVLANGIIHPNPCVVPSHYAHWPVRDTRVRDR
jgi:hypothetical protein